MKITADLLRQKILYNRKAAILLWFGLPLWEMLLAFLHHDIYNNFQIFRHVYFHERAEVNLYAEYPGEYFDVNLYGPVFGVVIALFAMLPLAPGAILWVMSGALLLFYAIDQLPLRRELRTAILVFSSIEMMTTASWLQSNSLIAACIILAFVFINREKDGYAVFFILLATFIKLYGVVGFAFFFFSRHRWKFIMWCFFWSAVFFFIPLVFTSFSFLTQSYADWFHALTAKAAKNIDLFIPHIDNFLQDISVQGMCRRILGLTKLKDVYVILPALLLFGLQYRGIKYYRDMRYRLYLLCSVLLFTVIFSSGSESPTYIIAFPAICTWYVMQTPSKKATAFFIFAFIGTSLSYSDIFTPYVRTYIVRPYALKALPSFIMWLIICVQMYRRQFLRVDISKLTRIDERKT